MPPDSVSALSTLARVRACSGACPSRDLATCPCSRPSPPLAPRHKRHSKHAPVGKRRDEGVAAAGQVQRSAADAREHVESMHCQPWAGHVHAHTQHSQRSESALRHSLSGGRALLARASCAWGGSRDDLACASFLPPQLAWGRTLRFGVRGECGAWVKGTGAAGGRWREGSHSGGGRGPSDAGMFQGRARPCRLQPLPCLTLAEDRAELRVAVEILHGARVTGAEHAVTKAAAGAAGEAALPARRPLHAGPPVALARRRLTKYSRMVPIPATMTTSFQD